LLLSSRGDRRGDRCGAIRETGAMILALGGRRRSWRPGPLYLFTGQRKALETSLVCPPVPRGGPPGLANHIFQWSFVLARIFHGRLRTPCASRRKSLQTPGPGTARHCKLELPPVS